MSAPAARPRRWAGFFLLLAVLALAAGVTPVIYNLRLQLTPVQAAKARARWRERAPRDYDLRCTEKLLREGRKFGLGLILASQQPEDFSSVAFANTATKIVFQVGDNRSTISRQLHRKIRDGHSFGEIAQLITKLPRGWAYVVSENVGRVVKVASFADRVNRWNG